MHLSLTAISNTPEYSDYAIVGVINTETGRVELQAEPLNPEAASYAISGSIDLRTGEIAIVAVSSTVGATTYTITGSLDPQTCRLYYVRAKPGSFHRPKYNLSGAIGLGTGQVDLMAESQRSIHPNYTISNATELRLVVNK